MRLFASWCMACSLQPRPPCMPPAAEYSTPLSQRLLTAFCRLACGWRHPVALGAAALGVVKDSGRPGGGAWAGLALTVAAERVGVAHCAGPAEAPWVIKQHWRWWTRWQGGVKQMGLPGMYAHELPASAGGKVQHDSWMGTWVHVWVRARAALTAHAVDFDEPKRTLCETWACSMRSHSWWCCMQLHSSWWTRHPG